MLNNTKTFINLPVKNLQASIAFFTKLGFKFNPQFTDDNATCMIISDDSYVMLLVEPFFKGFTNKEIPDTTKTSEIITALSADSRELVDKFVTTAFEAGATPSKEKYDMGFMYGWSFHDLDGHIWEIFWMDENHVQ